MFLLKLIKEKGLKKKINVIDLKSIIKYILILIFNYIRVIGSKKRSYNKRETIILLFIARFLTTLLYIKKSLKIVSYFAHVLNCST